MAIFQCSRYPQLIVLDPRDPKRTLARFRDGVFETEDEFTIAELAKREYIVRLDGAKGNGADPAAGVAAEPSPLPETDITEELTALLDEALAAQVLTLRGRRVYFNGRKVGDSKVNAVHRLRVTPMLAKEIEQALERARAQTVAS